MEKHKHKSKLLLTFAILTIFVYGFFAQNHFSFAASPKSLEELNSEKDQKRRDLLEIKQRIASLQKQITDQREKIASLKNEVELYQLQIDQTEEQIKALNTEIDVTNLEIVDTLNQINTTKEKIDAKLILLETLIREIYQNDRKSPLEIVLTHDNFSDVLREIQNTVTFQNKNQELLGELQTLQSELNIKQQSLSSQKTDLEKLKKEALDTEDTLVNQQNQKENLLTVTRGKESKYKELLDTVTEEEAKISQEISDLDSQIRGKIGDKALPPVTGTLTWPMEGILTQGYGKTGFTKLGYTFHNGIDLAAPATTPVYAAADGIVFATGTGKAAYGNWVVIKHALDTGTGIKNIFSLYAHLSRIRVTSGQAVLRGDLIGNEGNTGNTTRLLYGPERGYHLHFTIFDEEGFGIQDGAYPQIYGPYKIPFGYTYNPMDFLK